MFFEQIKSILIHSWKTELKYMKEPEHIVTIVHNFFAIKYYQTIFFFFEDQV